ncbi:MAG: 1-pyrroline-5-carboxylate dehydrogenase [Vicingaceae bacterium]|nr:MAG: 1-pyrroline-5-carboxylate dehydrogenase [Vicingaceae bacterium]
MSGFFKVPVASNEPVRNYEPGSEDREKLKAKINDLKNKEWDIPMWIDGKEVRTNEKIRISPPHDHRYTLGYYHKGNAEHVKMAIEAAMKAKPAWQEMSWESRASIFLKAAELLAGPYRYTLNAATMLCQSKNVYQAEIDSACELIDFFRFNVQFMAELYAEQPLSAPGVWNRMEYRPLEGFVFALTPFNFTSIAGNLPTAPALMGNTVVWKPSNTQIFSAWFILELLREAGLPDGVINIVYGDGATVGEVVFGHRDFGGIHFTGSTTTFKNIWQTIGNNIFNYRSYPRIVGETGGKDYIVAHPSADVKALITAISRGAFEYQGQKCSAASRIYIPRSIWPMVRDGVIADIESFKIGSPEDFTNFINAVIDEKSFDNIVSYIEHARNSNESKILAGGTYDKSSGYFITPTFIETTNPFEKCLCEEIFGPVLTAYVYDDNKFEETLKLIDESNDYALTGAVFAQDRKALEIATRLLVNSAGNFYINDKPTGAIVGQQPFGGARSSGTNDKAGAKMNLMRWVSARTIKENFNPPKDYRYPFMSDK